LIILQTTSKHVYKVWYAANFIFLGHYFPFQKASSLHNGEHTRLLKFFLNKIRYRSAALLVRTIISVMSTVFIKEFNSDNIPNDLFLCAVRQIGISVFCISETYQIGIKTKKGIGIVKRYQKKLPFYFRDYFGSNFKFIPRILALLNLYHLVSIPLMPRS